ncbi:hypothetical protein [Streptomyces sp. UH6]|uniref:hypothetical protein n=1 Tax=Streptomyces sp. UH6 TaxID=2748379 RepID=UPI0015D4FCA6|nr:hypothetical protein [Streptomyces sp. UH6]NYV72823.1 hypothetical protein [Streptomyces sp. UH6]
MADAAREKPEQTPPSRRAAMDRMPLPALPQRGPATATTRTIEAWLASARSEPAKALEEWRDQGVTLLPLGRHFSAVRIPVALVHSALDVDDSDGRRLAAVLRSSLNGPVIRDQRASGGVYYALVPWWSASGWSEGDGVHLLGDGVYLGVPALKRTDPPGSHWVLLPKHRHDLCSTGRVADLIRRVAPVAQEAAAADLDGQPDFGLASTNAHQP